MILITDMSHLQQQLANAQHQHLPQQQRVNVYNGSSNNKVPMCELSPAQTLKHMAEQHQHKSTMGMQFVRSPINQNAPHQKPMNMSRPTSNGGNLFPNDFNKFNVNEFINNSVQFNKMLGAPPGMDNNIIYAHHQQQQNKNQQRFKKQHYTQYSDSASSSDLSLSLSHSQPCSNTLSSTQQHANCLRGNIEQFVIDEHTSVSVGTNVDNKIDGSINSQPTSLQMKQAQQLNIIQQGPNHHNILVSVSFVRKLSKNTKICQIRIFFVFRSTSAKKLAENTTTAMSFW